MKRHPNPVRDAVQRIGALAVGYVRVAAVSQSDPRFGVNAQGATIRAFAKAEGIELIRVFEDAGESAHNTRRPGLLALIATIETGQANVIIISDLTRLARDTCDLRHLADLFARQGVSLVSATEGRGA
ncbi:MAG: recombinase family protein [Bryobacteraceae bacterium]